MTDTRKRAFPTQQAERLLGPAYWYDGDIRNDDFVGRVARAIAMPAQVAALCGHVSAVHETFGSRYYWDDSAIRYGTWWGGRRFGIDRRDLEPAHVRLRPQWLQDRWISVGAAISIYHGQRAHGMARVDRCEALVTSAAQLVRWPTSPNIWWLHLADDSGIRCYVGRATDGGGAAWHDAAPLFEALSPSPSRVGALSYAIAGDE